MQTQAFLILKHSENGQQIIESISTSAAILFDSTPSEIEGKTIDFLSKDNEKVKFFAEQLKFNSLSFSLSNQTNVLSGVVSVQRILAEDNREIIFFNKQEDPLRGDLPAPPEMFEKVFHKTADAFLLLCNRTFVSCNPSAVKLLNATDCAEITNKTPHDLSPELQPCGTPSDIKAKIMMDTALSKGSHIFEWKHRKMDGEEFYAEVSLTWLSDMDEEYFLTIVRDISDKKIKESALRKSEGLHKTLADNSEDIIWLMDTNLNNLYISPAIEKHVGYTVDEYMTLPIEQRVDAEDLKNIFQLFSYHSSLDFNDAATKKLEIELRYLHKNGSFIWGHSVMTAIRDENNKVVEILGITRNISERKQSELALRESEAKFRALSEASPMAVFIYQGHKFIYANPALEKLTGYNLEELKAINFYDLIHSEFRELVKERGMLRQTGASIPNRYEFKVLNKNGLEAWIDFTGTYIEYEGKGAALGTAYDITERKLAEEALSQSEEKYRMLIQNQTDLVVKVDKDGCFEYVSPSYCTTFGKTEAQLIGSAFHPLVHEDDIGHTLDEMEKLKTAPHTCYVEQRAMTSEGWCWFAWNDKAILNESGEITSIIAVGRDITQRKLAEVALAESEEKLRSLVELAVDGIVHGDKDGVITDVNKRFLEITMLSYDEVEKKHLSKLFEEYVLSKEPLRFDLLNTGQTIVREREFRRKDNEIIVVEMHSKRMPNGTYQAFFRDITHRKQAENQLKEQKRFLETLINNLPGIVYRCKNDKDWSMEFISGRCEELTGYPGSDLINNKVRSFNSIIHPNFHEKLWSTWQNTLKNREIFSEEYIIVDPFGNEKWVFEQGTGVYDDNNELLALEGFIMDINDRKKAEDDLLQSQFNYKMLAGYNQLLSRAALMFAMADTVEEVELMVLKYYKQLTGGAITMLMFYDRETSELSVRHYSIPDDFKNFIFSILGESAFYNTIKINPQIEKDMISLGVIKTSKIADVSFGAFPEEILNEIEKSASISEVVVSTIQTKNQLIGTLSAFLQTQSSVPEEVLKTFSQLAGFALVRKRTEMELIEAKNRAEQSDRMKSIFLANISHEVRTPMNAIMGFTELLERPDLKEAERLKYTSIITNAGEQLLGLIDDLIDLAKIETKQMKILYSEFDVVQLLKNLFDMMRLRFEQKGIEFTLELNLKTDTFPIISDPLRLKQIVINMLDNAYKYTHSGEVSFGLTNLGNDFQIFVKDSGIGISPSDAERIFERFVQLEADNTNSFGGKGLGLSISRSLAEILGGQIHLESAVHKGTVFYLSLPIIPQSKTDPSIGIQ